MASVVLALWFRLPDAPPDLSPWDHWRAPVVMDDIAAAPEVGPVLVTVEYGVPAERQKEFEKLIDRYGRVRRRDGASRWGIFRDMGSDDRYVEVFRLAHGPNICANTSD